MNLLPYIVYCSNILPLVFSEQGLVPIYAVTSILELAEQTLDGLVNPAGKIDETDWDELAGDEGVKLIYRRC